MLEYRSCRQRRPSLWSGWRANRRIVTRGRKSDVVCSDRSPHTLTHADRGHRRSGAQKVRNFASSEWKIPRPADLQAISRPAVNGRCWFHYPDGLTLTYHKHQRSVDCMLLRLIHYPMGETSTYHDGLVEIGCNQLAAEQIRAVKQIPARFEPAR